MRCCTRPLLALALTFACTAGGQDRGFVLVAEGFTSPDRRTGIDAAYRMFTAPEAEEICRVRHPSRLARVGDERITLTAGTRFEYASLSIVALDAAGGVIQRVPIFVYLDPGDPKLIAWGTDNLSAFAGFLPIAAGTIRLRLTTACPADSPASLTIALRVDPAVSDARQLSNRVH